MMCHKKTNYIRDKKNWYWSCYLLFTMYSGFVSRTNGKIFSL